MFEAYVTNLGLYPERGVEVGEYLKFPTTPEAVRELFDRIGIDGHRYSEYFITNYESDVLGLSDWLSEYESLDELNYLAHLLEELTPDELEKYEAVLAFGDHTSQVKDLINLTQNLDHYSFYPGIDNEEALGRYYVEEGGALQIPDYIEPYFDYEAYGRDIDLSSTGCFVPGGYINADGDRFIEHYSGVEDIPQEYRISNVKARDEKEETRSILAAIKEFQPAPPAPAKEKAGPSNER